MSSASPKSYSLDQISNYSEKAVTLYIIPCTATLGYPALGNNRLVWDNYIVLVRRTNVSGEYNCNNASLLWCDVKMIFNRQKPPILAGIGPVLDIP
jgi:hypothetical protein